MDRNPVIDTWWLFLVSCHYSFFFDIHHLTCERLQYRLLPSL